VSGTRQLNLVAALGLWASACLAATFYASWQGYGGRRFAVTLCVFALLFAAEILVAARGVQERVSTFFSMRGPLSLAIVLASLLFIAYLTYALGTSTFLWQRAGIAAACTFVPPLLLASAGQRKPGVWQDYAAAAALWLPWKIHWLHGLWPYPQERLGYVLAVLLAMNVGVAAFLFVRRLDGVGYSIAWGRGWGVAVALSFVLFALIAIPLGQVIHFVRFDPAYSHLKTLPVTALGIFFFTAWPEEFLFRGLLQNLFSRTFSNAEVGWLVASVIFGLAHITNYGVFPNWRYVILATIAGVFYGRAWRRTGSIFASALVHTLVNTTWHFFFRTL